MTVPANIPAKCPIIFKNVFTKGRLKHLLNSQQIKQLNR